MLETQEITDKKVLLHSCCAPCSAAIIEWMMAHGIEPVLYFCNPNIYPQEEYEKRKAELIRHATTLGLDFYEETWDHNAWLCATRGLENEPEKGARCSVCFALRLKKAAQKCKELGLKTFATTLASSRWKDLEQVNRAGRAAAFDVGVTFWEKNWRKGGLQDRRNALIKELGFYNQTWCGCEYSAQRLAQKKHSAS